MMSNQQTEYSKTTEDFLKKMENEQIARKNLEALILKERKENERKIKEAEAQNDNITLNFQMAVAAKTSSETKLTTLTDQKKLLVKEVKQLRKKLEELTTNNEEMKVLNDRLLKAASALKLSVTLSVSSSPKTIPKEENTLVSASSISTTDEGVAVGDATVETNEEKDTAVPSSTTNTTSTNSDLEDLLAYTDQLIAKSEVLNPSSASHHNSIDSRGRSFDTNSDDPSASLANKSPSSTTNPLSRAMNLFRSTGGSGSAGVEDSDHPRHGSDDKSSGHYSRNNSIVGDEDHYEERPSWEMPAMALRELGKATVYHFFF
jgi:regulator of replication initiation timing